MSTAKERRRLKRLSLQQAEPTLSTGVVSSSPPAIVTSNASSGGDGDSQLNAKQRRLLRRKRERQEKDGAGSGVVAASEEQVTTAATDEVTRKRRRRASKALIPRKIHRTLFVGQLPFTTTVEELRRHFHEAGEIQVRMLTKKSDGSFRGMAFIELASDEALGAALSRHHTLFKGRRINVELTASGGGTKSTLRKERIDKLRDKQRLKQQEKAVAIVTKFAHDPETKFTPDDIDDRLIDFVTWFDIETSKKALSEFDTRVTDTVRNRKAFMMDILKKYRDTDGQIQVDEFVRKKQLKQQQKPGRNNKGVRY